MTSAQWLWIDHWMEAPWGGTVREYHASERSGSDVPMTRCRGSNELGQCCAGVHLWLLLPRLPGPQNRRQMLWRRTIKAWELMIKAALKLC